MDLGLWTKAMRVRNNKPGLLALEDGRVFRGRSWAAEGESTGEMVFNTSMTGYQEVLTDPSYAGQIVCMTYPLIGNYGVNSEDEESSRPWVEGFVVREASRVASSWRAQETLDAYLKRWKVVAIEGVDTRALVRHIRDKGAMRACISTIDLNEESVINKARQSPSMENRELASVVTTKEAYEVAPEGERAISRGVLRLWREAKLAARAGPTRLPDNSCARFHRGCGSDCDAA